MFNTALLPRPWSSDKPRVAGYEPIIRGNAERISRAKRNAWRATVTVDGCRMATSHHDTRAAAESHLVGMLAAYADVHYAAC